MLTVHRLYDIELNHVYVGNRSSKELINVDSNMSSPHFIFMSPCQSKSEHIACSGGAGFRDYGM